ncbi:uncharacterized protein LOC135694868 isoform X2 [Rhopilema esculentum]|uniref:uncharacterized protein LOC135694868 isoform X2 n=1 Tax=Rhopilema esculentum TaxID=499914 RepID=UPI0031D45A5F
MATFHGGIHEFVGNSEENQFLTSEDQIKIIKEEELDYCLGSTQDTDEDSELPKSMVDLILERNENLTDMSPDWKKDSMQDFLKYLTDSGIEPDGNKTELEENMTQSTAETSTDLGLQLNGDELDREEEDDNDYDNEDDEEDCNYKDTDDDEKKSNLRWFRNERSPNIGLHPSMQESNKDDEVSVEDTDPEPTLIRQSTTRTRNKRSRGGRQVPAKIRLEDFLRDLLEKRLHVIYLHWICAERKEFTIANRRQVANLWGIQKKKKMFTADKLQREIRNLLSARKLERMGRKDHFRFLT